MRRKGSQLGRRVVNRGASRVKLGQVGSSMIRGPRGMSTDVGFGAANMITGARTTTKVGFGDIFGYF